MKAIKYVKKQIKELKEIADREGAGADRYPLGEAIGILQTIELLIEQDEMERVRMPEVEKEHES